MSDSTAAAEHMGRNAFHALAALGSVKPVAKLLSTTPKKVVAANLAAKDKTGRTPLHLAAYCGHVRVLKAFLDASPEAGELRDGDGNTARDALRRPHAAVLGDPECHTNFQRLVHIDKNGFQHQDFGHGGPMDVWDVAMSNKTSVVVVEPSGDAATANGAGDPGADRRSVYCMIHNELQQLDLGPHHTPRFVATSNVHSLVVTANRCFSWGKNKNGVLGLDVEEKVVLEPRMIDFPFGSDDPADARHTNTFSALTRGAGAARVKDPLIGVACCDFFSCCYTTTKLWCWGTNRGQMLARAPLGAEVLDPELVFEPANRIRSVACCDSALVVLTTNGQVHVLSNGRATKAVLTKSQASGAPVESIAAKGNYFVALTAQGRLVRAKLPASPGSDEAATPVWTPRRPKDEVASFDLGENGTVIVATRAGLFKVEDGRDIQELKNLKGMPITTIRTDSQCKASLAVCNLDASLSYLGDKTPVTPRYWVRDRHVQWRDGLPYDLRLRVAGDGPDAFIEIHRAVLYARCPTLRGLLDGSSAELVAAPSGSSMWGPDPAGGLVIRHAPLDSVRVFRDSLYAAQGAFPESSTAGLSAPDRHEFHALHRLATRDLGPGLWEARQANIGCDLGLQSGARLHSAVLRAASPVLAAQLTRWSGTRLDCPALSANPAIEEAILHYVYTLRLPESFADAGLCHQAERLFELWQAADELLMPNLSSTCERGLFNMIDLETVIPFLRETAWSQHIVATKLFSALLDVVVRHLSFFMPLLAELDSKTLDSIEGLFLTLEGTEPADPRLADSFEALKARLSTPSSAGAAKKKNRTVSIPASPSPSATSSSSSLPLADSSPSASVSPASSSPSLAARKPAPANADPIKPLSAAPDLSSGWIQAKKKPRAGSSNAGNDRTPVKVALSSRSSTPASVASLPTLGAATTSSPWGNSSPLNARDGGRTMAGSLGGAPGRAVPGSAASSPAPSSAGSSTSSLHALPKLGASLPKLGETAKLGDALPKLGDKPKLGESLPKLGESLPKLGDSLPKLGDKPRTKSAAKSSKPKFNSKTTMQFDSPFTMAQEFQKQAEPATPWKQVPKVVRTSPSVLEKLEREHEINNRRMAGRSVWGVKS